MTMFGAVEHDLDIRLVQEPFACLVLLLMEPR